MNENDRLPSWVRRACVLAHALGDDGVFPNNDRFPLLLYRGAVAVCHHEPALRFEKLFARNGWTGVWRNGVYPFHHYHSSAHEVLGVYAGRARVQFGGECGVVLTVEPGDAVIIPAGVAHRQLSCSAAFGVVGAYSAGDKPDLCRAAECRDSVATLRRPARDPVYGERGPLLSRWRDRGSY